MTKRIRLHMNIFILHPSLTPKHPFQLPKKNRELPYLGKHLWQVYQSCPPLGTREGVGRELPIREALVPHPHRNRWKCQLNRTPGTPGALTHWTAPPIYVSALWRHCNWCMRRSHTSFSPHPNTQKLCHNSLRSHTHQLSDKKQKRRKPPTPFPSLPRHETKNSTFISVNPNERPK